LHTRVKRSCGSLGRAEPLALWRRPMSTPLRWNLWVSERLGVLGDGMSGRNEQRKTGTARGSPRRSRTAKAPRISRCAAKSRCACERGGWGRLSDDGPGQHNPIRSEGPWGRWSYSTAWRCSYRVDRSDFGRIDVKHEGRRQTGRQSVYAGSRLKLMTYREGLA
jgi:hypothetical protein